MNILYDHQIFLAQGFGGISRYFSTLMEGIRHTSDVSYNFSMYGNHNYFQSSEMVLKPDYFQRRQFRRYPQKMSEANRSYILKKLKEKDISVFHPTYYDHYYLDVIRKPFVITIHDMIYEKYAGFFSPDDPTPYEKRVLIERADKIIAISHKTKEDILYYNRIDEDKIDVVYHGIDLDKAITYEENMILPAEYVLYVGSRFGYKNFPLFVEAFGYISTKKKDLKLVVVGAALGSAEKELLYRNGILDKILQMSVTDSQLNTLYKNAIMLVYPSLYEGFGLPILEAFKNGCPVLLSRASCFPEIAGDSAAFFEPTSVESLIYEMLRIIEDPFLRISLIDRGRTKLQEYNVDKCVKGTLYTYRSVI
ncbi:glycosyltransferase family 4 protein [Sphingobacterium phlebotomi]|uniref:Glycosyltransferase family 4 protein n=1 Tax=Sphingobacterium phlebotomi TaxID=2605433 RepID=A0A5D4HCE3_9SPHI|nr:glycosyltransferase family 1 protein [Sphingobacterium phlebotomi]TYR38234.1 glycosyltransferase family 4 protein [Sphingobacterium phlebotomi]